MSLFGGSTKNSVLGIDIGAGGIKVVEMTNEKGKACLMTYGYSRRKLADLDASLLDNPKVAADLLNKIVAQSGAKTNKAISALPGSKVFSAIISVPRVKDEKELKPLIEAQARKLLPLPLEEMILDSKLVDELHSKREENKKIIKEKNNTEEALKKTPQGNVRVLVTGAPKTLVQKYVDIFKLAKLELVALETESFALIRSLIGKDRSSILIIDMGSNRTNLTISEKGIPFLIRSINIGGIQVTNGIAKQMNMQPEEAEQLKQDLSARNKSGDMLPVVEQTLLPLINEINYTFDQYKQMETTIANKVDKIILTGGSSHLPGLTEYIANKTGINTYNGDPWARIVYSDDLRPILDDIGPRLAVSIGLAMRDTE
ncbi:MAG: pilus assembly protein PilM [Candidatus Uhrbacteria bacterium]